MRRKGWKGKKVGRKTEWNGKGKCRTKESKRKTRIMRETRGKGERNKRENECKE